MGFKNGDRFETVRRIVLELDKSPDEPMVLSAIQFADMPNIDSDTLDDFIDRLIEFGLIEVTGSNAYNLTWDGQDFVGFSSDPVIRRAAMQVASHLSFDCFRSILKDLMFWKARKYAEEYSKSETDTKRKR